MARDDAAASLRAAYDFQCALVGNGNLTEESFKACQTTAKELFNELCNLERPWSARTVGEAAQDGVMGLVAAYKRLVGDPDDPVFRAKLLADLESHEAAKAAAAVARIETDEERIDRLTRQRDAARSRK